MSREAQYHWRDVAAWLSFPVNIIAFMGAAVFCLQQGYAPEYWVPALAASNFFVLVALEQIIPRNPSYNLFKDKQSINDLVFNSINGALRPTIGAGVAVFVAWLAASGFTTGISGLWPGEWPFAIQCLLGILCVSFMDYWNHRLAHTIDRLWWFHSLHHSATQMHALKGGRIHFIDEILHDFFTALPFLLFGAPIEVILFAGMWGVFTGNLVHANVDQRFPSWAHYFLPTVQLHNLHHSMKRQWQDSNYSGTLPLWDVIFGTLSHPDKCELGSMGIEENYISQNILKQYYLPLLWQWRSPFQNTSEKSRKKL